MTQLLISVKNKHETKLALAADVDIIDLKDPSNGALGALDLHATKEIVRLVNGCKPVSATVGELHTSVDALILDIKARADAGVDIVKIAVSDLFQAVDFYEKIQTLTKAGVKIVAIFFADSQIDLSLLPKWQQAGFYGAMLDTKIKKVTHCKQIDLLSLQTKSALQLFTQLCHQHQLLSGLAGSLKPQHIESLIDINPTYIGFRGGVCENLLRTNGLNQAKMQEVQKMLRNGNKNNIKPHLILGLALHS